MFQHVFVFFVGLLLLSRASNVWREDKIDVLITSLVIPDGAERNASVARMVINANGPLYVEDSAGTFRVLISSETKSRWPLRYTSPCFPASIGQSDLASALLQAPLSFTSNDVLVQSKIGSFFNISAKKFANESDGRSTTTFVVNLSSYSMVSLKVNITTRLCSPFKTIGSWQDAHRWSLGRVPISSDDVVFPLSTGVVKLSADAEVNSLSASGGIFMSSVTKCPPGWSASPINLPNGKCYKLFSEPNTFNGAETTCRNAWSSNSRLVQISSHAEQRVVNQVCRSRNSTGTAAVHGCWIGLQFESFVGDFMWLELPYSHPVQQLTSFRDWRRGEPNNHTFSEGVSTIGELCITMVAWQEDPLIQEQGSWNDVACVLKKPFVCQTTAYNARFTLSVKTEAVLHDVTVIGGVVKLLSSGVLDGISILRGGSLEAISTASTSIVEVSDDLLLTDGSRLLINSLVRVRSGVIIGESITESSVAEGMGPSVVIATNGTLTFSSNCPSVTMQSFSFPPCSSVYSVLLNSNTLSTGRIVVENFVDVTLTQGADLSQASINLVGKNSSLYFDGISARMSTYDSFDLVLSHRNQVIGEFNQSDAALRSSIRGTTQPLMGVYKLKISDKTGRQDITRCIPYHASAQLLADILASSPLIQERGGVTVVRYGQGEMSIFGFGYTYRLEMDAPSTEVFPRGPIDISVYGIGVKSQCTETIVPLADVTGRKVCPGVGRISPVDPNACVIPPVITVTRLDKLSYVSLSGLGTLGIKSGVHRLPPISTVPISVSSGTGIVSADIINWYHLEAVDTGRLVFAGKGWIGWDSAIVLFEPVWTEKRGLAALNVAPGFQMTLTSFYIDRLGSVLTVCPNSNLTWEHGVWAGGVIGGRSTIRISKHIVANGAEKSLRYKNYLVVIPGAVMDWHSGNISLADGANIYIEGKLNIRSDGGLQFIGEALLMRAPDTNFIATKLLEREPQLQWHGYIDDLLPAELRGGWYQNPLCGDDCLATNELVVRGNGEVNLANSALSTFVLPLNLLDKGTLQLGSEVHINLASGGLCGNQAVMQISDGTTLELSGGKMLMDSFCKIVGAGELLVSAGQHSMGFSVDSHITISGGAVVWPLSRGMFGSINFYGGLLMDKTGLLQVEPFSTTIHIHREVTIRDQSRIQFPELGLAAEPSQFDELDAPAISPNGNFTVAGVMKFEGGTIAGKVVFTATSELYLSGQTKYIRSLAQLLNRGHCEWSGGDIIADNGGNFVNMGTVQMGDGVRFFNSSSFNFGTILPVEVGGDVYAKNYHGWDMDAGGLDFNEYIKLRSVFVSKVPEGWTPEEQLQALKGK